METRTLRPAGGSTSPRPPASCGPGSAHPVGQLSCNAGTSIARPVNSRYREFTGPPAHGGDPDLRRLLSQSLAALPRCPSRTSASRAVSYARTSRGDDDRSGWVDPALVDSFSTSPAATRDRGDPVPTCRPGFLPGGQRPRPRSRGASFDAVTGPGLSSPRRPPQIIGSPGKPGPSAVRPPSPREQCGNLTLGHPFAGRPTTLCSGNSLTTATRHPEVHRLPGWADRAFHEL